MLLLYNGPNQSRLAHLLSSKDEQDIAELQYHISLVDLLAACSLGKNVYTEMKCQVSLLKEAREERRAKRHTHTHIYIYIYEKKAKAGAHDSQTMYLPSFSQGLLSLEDTVSALCLPETTIPLKSAYLSFLLHCILDTEVGSRHLL